MVIPRATGTHKLILTKQNQKILQLDLLQYIIIAVRIGYTIQPIIKRAHKTDCILSIGRYQIYEVVEESDFSEYLHLELEAGIGMWQGYILPDGFPVTKNITAKIIPVCENISKGRLNDSKFDEGVNNKSGVNYEETLSIKYR